MVIREQTIGLIKNRSFDLLVIGGGITGSGIARDAALRGLKTLLVERDDFASGTSSRSGKLVHGGLRYLADFHFRLVFDACQERHLLMTRVAPHIVKPIRFLKPVYERSRYSLWNLSLGMAVYESLALFRTFRRFRILSATEVSALEKAIVTRNLKGAVSYFDCCALDYRLTVETLKSAVEQGARVVNYCSAEQIGYDENQKHHPVELLDRSGVEHFSVTARVIINAAGPWADEVVDRVDERQQATKFNLRTSRGIHLLIDQSRLPLSQAIALESPDDHRDLYAVPWQDRVLIGTTDHFVDDPDQMDVPSEEIDYLLRTLASTFPDAQIRREDILGVYSGVRPLIGSDQGIDESKLPRDFEMRFSDSGFVSITGGKLTTYRHMAEQLLDQVVERYFSERKLNKCATRAPISGGDVSTEIDEMAQPNLYLEQMFGSNRQQIAARIAQDPDKGQRIAPDLPFTWAHIDYILEEEFVVKLEDLVIRRLGGFLFTRPEFLELCMRLSAYVGRKLGWSESRQEQEIASLRQYLQRA